MATALERQWARQRLMRARVVAAGGLLVARGLRSTYRAGDAASFDAFVREAIPRLRVVEDRVLALTRADYLTRGEASSWTPVRRTDEQIGSGLYATGWKVLGQGGPIEKAQSAVMGAATRQLVAGSQQSIIDSIQRSPQRLAYMLVTSGSPCHFCAMLASRGPVYRGDSLDESDIRFIGPGTSKVHDNCGCALVVVAARDTDQMVEWLDLQQEWLDVTKDFYGQDKLRAWSKHWYENHPKAKVPRWQQFAST